jgi:NADH dehydrogenase
VLLIDRNNYHLFTPLLYQVASALLDPGEVARPVRQLIRPLRNADFLQASVSGVDFEGRRLLTNHGPVAYDYLVLATGAQTDYFGNPSLAQHAMGLKDLDEGLAIRNHVLSRFEESRWTDDPARRRALLSFAVVGGGPTGVEMAGAISELIRLVLRKDYRDLDTNEVRVVLIEAAPHVLAAFVPSLREAARRSLERKGIEVMLNTKVDSVTDSSVRLVGGQEIAAATIIWTAGVKASALGQASGVPLVRQARIEVDPSLQISGHPVVFVIGDLAGAGEGGDRLPMLIPVAMQAGRHVAASISDMVARGGARAFRYKDPGIMATIGRNSAVAQLGWLHLSGFPGWLMWLAVHLVNVVSFRSKLIVLVNWAWEYLFYDRPVRLIVRARQ